jgi:hypothetical protein
MVNIAVFPVSHDGQRNGSRAPIPPALMLIARDLRGMTASFGHAPWLAVAS